MISCARFERRSGARWMLARNRRRGRTERATARCVVFDAAGTMVVSVEPMSEYTLGSCLRLGSDALRSPARKSLAAYQACRALARVHERIWRTEI